MVRRNIIPNPLPVGTAGWNHSESNATLVDFDNGLHYEAVATAAGCQAGVLWNDPTQITVRPGENYGIRLELDVTSRPDVGMLRVMVLWKALDGVTGISTWFDEDRAVGEHAVLGVITAPEGAHRASLAILYTTVGSDTPDTTTHIIFDADHFLMEPLGPQVFVYSDAVTNLMIDPSVEYGGNGWLPHTPTNDPDADGAVWEPQTGWASDLDDGTQSMRHTITTADHVIGGTLTGFIGSYLGQWPVNPGDIVRMAIAVNVLDGPPTGPGLFPEEFFYFYDGDPAHTVEHLHLNGDTIYQPLVLGEQIITMEGECPDAANLVQVTCVMAAEDPEVELDCYMDCAIVTINDVIVAYFDGDTPGAGWGGLPGRSTSRMPGINARVPGDWFSGDSFRGQWEGAENASMSTYTPPSLQHTADVTPVPSVEAMRFVVAASAPD